MSSIIRKNIADGVSFNSINEKRFKTAKISVTMIVPIDKNRCAAYAMLPSVLLHSCKKYPTPISLNRVLNKMYGTDVGGYCKKMGESIAITLTAVGIDDRYTMNNEKISSQIIDLLCEIIFNPNVENGAFNQKEFDQCKRQLLEAIDGEFNEKRGYAISQMVSAMCADELYGIKRYGSREDVEKLTAQDLYKVWQYVLANSRVEVMMIGNDNTDDAENIIKEKFSAFNRSVPKIETEIRTTVNDVKSKVECSDIAQAKLVMGFRTSTAQPNQNTIPMKLTVAVLGGTPTSKFFTNIREKMSLCYYCAARFDKLKGIVTVDSGVEQENIERTIQEVKNQLDEMKKGNITDFEIESAKLAIINSCKSTLDTVSGTEAWYIGQMLDKDILTVEEYVEQVNSVDKETIVRLANTIILDTIYVLKPEKEVE